jgi:hypothetical protein
MNFSHRCFLLTADDKIVRLPSNHFERVFQMDPPTERIPECASQRMRVAGILVELQHRKPVRIVRTDYWYVHFDSNGTMDLEKNRRQSALSMEAFVGGILYTRVGTGAGNVVRASHRFAARRYDHEARWKPSATLESRIFDAALGVIKCRAVPTVSTA